MGNKSVSCVVIVGCNDFEGVFDIDVIGDISDEMFGNVLFVNIVVVGMMLVEFV